MDDLISRQAALKELENLNIASFYELNEHSKEAYTEVKAMLKLLPSVDIRERLDNAYMHGATEAEAKYRAILDTMPKVVRCKDCKHYQFANNRAFGLPVKRCEVTGFEDVEDEDFCSRGERKDGAKMEDSDG